MRKSGGLDVEVAGSTEEVQKGFAEAEDWTLKQREEVQKGFAEAADWTLKRREGRKKSKRDLQKWQIGR